PECRVLSLNFPHCLFLLLSTQHSLLRTHKAAACTRCRESKGLGYQRSSHSFHKFSLRYGITSLAYSSVLRMVCSRPRLPNWHRAITWPTFISLSASRMRSRTVVGDPAMMKP